MQVVEAVELSQATMRKIKQNLVWAFLYNIVSATGRGRSSWSVIGGPGRL